MDCRHDVFGIFIDATIDRVRSGEVQVATCACPCGAELAVGRCEVHGLQLEISERIDGELLVVTFSLERRGSKTGRRGHVAGRRRR